MDDLQEFSEYLQERFDTIPLNADLEQKADYIENHLTDEDIAAWHSGEMTTHVELLLATTETGEIQIWGSRVGTEPLSVIAR